MFLYIIGIFSLLLFCFKFAGQPDLGGMGVEEGEEIVEVEVAEETVEGAGVAIDKEQSEIVVNMQ